jgi:hypothetical protein
LFTLLAEEAIQAEAHIPVAELGTSQIPMEQMVWAEAVEVTTGPLTEVETV